ncbi:MAG: RNA polymerase sigma factor [Polyangiaceae bacterium]
MEGVWRREAARVIARLSRLTRDVGLAEELAQDALVAALETWPQTGVPVNPGAWLVTTGKNRALDRLRKRKLVARKHEALGAEMMAPDPSPADEAMDDFIGDDLLRLVFQACHPVLSLDAQVARTLRKLGGLTTDQIASAFLAPSPTIAQRIVRAKRRLSEAQVAFELPRGEELWGRTQAVLRVIYLVFNEGHAATAGDALVRKDLCEQAKHLGRMMLSLLPREPEVYGLVALMEIQGSRFAAREDGDGRPVLLLDQDRGSWDQEAIARGLGALCRAHLLGGRGPYVLQAEIAACHARARRAEDTDWARIAARYAELARLMPSPVVELNRALAVSMAEGPAAGLAIVDRLRGEPALADWHRLPAARAEMLLRLGRVDEAIVELERAAEGATHPREREQLLERAARCREGAMT